MYRKPTKAEIATAVGRTVPDLIAPGLVVLFCGINPGLYSAASGHHFARPGNRFWPTLQAAGFTDRQLRPWEEQQLLEQGLGVTNLVARATTTAAELGRDELQAGRTRLERKVRRFRPRAVAVLGIGAYRAGFNDSKAVIGRQPALLAGAALWVLPNPSGLNANHQLPDLALAFRELRNTVGGGPSPHFDEQV